MSAQAWNCEAIELAPDGSPGEALKKPLTVGETFLLRCAGESVALDPAKLALKTPKAAEYALRVLEARVLEPGSATFVATSYQVGDHKLSDVELGDGRSSVKLEGLSFKVASVLKQGEQAEPFGPPQPRDLAYPAWLWGAGALALACFVAAVGAAYSKRSRRLRFFRELERKPIASTPYAAFARELRTLQRGSPVYGERPWTVDEAREFLSALESSFRWFLARETGVPFFDGPFERSMRELARREPDLARRCGDGVNRAFTEARRAQEALIQRTAYEAGGNKAVTTPADARQILALCRAAADGLERALRKRGVSRGLAELQAGRAKALLGSWRDAWSDVWQGAIGRASARSARGAPRPGAGSEAGAGSTGPRAGGAS